MTEQGIAVQLDQLPFTARRDKAIARAVRPLMHQQQPTRTGTGLRIARALVVRAARAVGAASGRRRAVALARSARVADAARRRARGPVAPRAPAARHFLRRGRSGGRGGGGGRDGGGCDCGGGGGGGGSSDRTSEKYQEMWYALDAYCCFDTTYQSVGRRS